jgi:hypothetical protein
MGIVWGAKRKSSLIDVVSIRLTRTGGDACSCLDCVRMQMLLDFLVLFINEVLSAEHQ